MLMFRFAVAIGVPGIFLNDRAYRYCIADYVGADVDADAAVGADGRLALDFGVTTAVLGGGITSRNKSPLKHYDGGDQGVERRLSEGFEYRHLGCFEADYFSEENITLALTALELTPGMCNERCRGLHSRYFATQKGEQCWCTPDTRFDYSRLGVGICDSWCGADGSTKCGGVTAADVYALEEGDDDDGDGDGQTATFFSQGGSGNGTKGSLVEVDGDDDGDDSALLLDELLELHNAARCMHGAEPLEFSEVVAFSARVHASSLTDENNCGSLAEQEEGGFSGSGLGENVFVCAVPSDDPDDCFSPQGAMVDFYEGQLGNGDPADFGEHATRVLWKSSTELGCVLEGCESGGLAFTVLVCLYAPPLDYDSSTGEELGAQTLDPEDCGYSFGG